jgi:hypothetical protein
VFVSRERADLLVSVNLTRPDPRHWLAQIDLQDNDGKSLGHRELLSRGESCTSINESLALIVSLMVDVTRERLQQQPPPIARAEAKSLWRSDLLLLGSASVGQPRGLLEGITLAGEFGPRRNWLFAMRATAWAPKQTGDAAAGAKFWVDTAEADLCGAAKSFSRLDHTFCLGPAFGILHTRAAGFDVNRAETSLVADLVARVSATWWGTPFFGVRIGLGAGVPLAQREYYATQSDGSKMRLISRAWLVPSADLGIALRLGQ